VIAAICQDIPRPNFASQNLGGSIIDKTMLAATPEVPKGTMASA